MVDKARPQSEILVSPVDSRGRRIAPSVLTAAETIAPRAVGYAERLRVDPALAASLLEKAAVRVSRALKIGQPDERLTRNLDAYLFFVFLRLLNSSQTQQLLAADLPQELFRTTNNSVDPRTSLDRKILLDEVLMRCDPLTREMWYRRIEGFSWKEIGELFKISGHAAESRFSQMLRKVRRRLGLK